MLIATINQGKIAGTRHSKKARGNRRVRTPPATS